MIEFLGLIAFFFIRTIFKNDYTYFYTMANTVSVIIFFIIFVRFFLFAIVNNLWKITIRYKILTIMYMVSLIIGCTGSALFTGLFKVNVIAQYVIPVVVYLTTFILFIVPQINDFKQARDFVQTFFILKLIDTLLILAFLVLDIFVSSATLAKNNWILDIYFVLLLLLSIINGLALNRREYWLHKQALFMKIERLIQTNDIESVIVPLKRAIETDLILQELKIILNYSFTRPIEFVDLIRTFYELLRKHKIPRERAITVSGEFAAIMVINLMQRKGDFSFMPTKVVQLYQKLSMSKKVNRRF